MDFKYEIRIAGQMRKANFINESGLYTLIFRSKKESARKFRKWITSEVIPTIRKTGKFNAPETKMLNSILGIEIILLTLIMDTFLLLVSCL